MTLLDVVNLLYGFYQNNDVFNLETHFAQLINNTDDIKRDQALVLSALEELEKMEIVKRIEFEQISTTISKQSKLRKTIIWILKKPLIMQEQEIRLTPDIVVGISTCLNGFSKSTKNESFQCNSLNITAEDLRNLLRVIALMIEAQQDKKEA